MRRGIWAGALAGIAVFSALSLLSAGQAGADRLPFPSTVSIRSTEPGFQGKVRAPLGFCRGHRRVTLFKAVDGGPDEAMGQTRTDPVGHWRIAVSGFAGISLARFYATAHGAKGHIAGVPYECARAKSRTIKLGG